jgi:hypothetical protein
VVINIEAAFFSLKFLFFWRPSYARGPRRASSPSGLASTRSEVSVKNRKGKYKSLSEQAGEK